MTPAAAVIIPHYNDTARLARCLAALWPQVGPEVEVVVADNASTEPLDAVRAGFPGVRFVTEPGRGAALARNLGVAVTAAEGLIFLDADCVPGPGWLARALGNVRVGELVGGRIDLFEETEGPRSGAEAFETVFAFNQRLYIEKKGFSVTANLVTTRAVFEATGPFVSGLSEDTDWCRRAVAQGFRLSYDDAMAVRHPSRQDWPALEKKWRRLTREMFELNGRSLGGRLKWALRGLAMGPSALVHAPKVLRHPALDGGEKLRALGTLFRLRLARAGWMLRQAAGGGL